MSDAELIGLYLSGDERAVEETERQYGALCFRIAENILGDPRDAEECVSDAMLRLWQSIPPEEPASLRAYLCGIVKNAALNRMRDAKRQKRSPGAEPMTLSELNECLPAPGGVEKAFEAAELTSALNRWLASLKTEERALFIRRYWFEDGLAEIASSFGLTRTAAAKRLARLRSKLRSYLESEDISI